MKPQHPDDGTYCPLWRKPCVRVCHTCAWWFLVRGKHPQTNADVDEWKCAIALTPLLQIETTQAQSRTAASVDEFRKEANAANNVQLAGAIAHLNNHMRDAIALSPPPEPQKLIGN